MNLIRQGLERGFDVSLYSSLEFNHSQMSQILEGLKSNVDVSIYTDPNFTWLQMRQIRTRFRKWH